MPNTQQNCKPIPKPNIRTRRKPLVVNRQANRNAARERVVKEAIAHRETQQTDPERQQEAREAREAEQARQANLGSRRRRTQARMDDDRTEAEKAAAKSGRKSAGQKARRSEAWWSKMAYTPEYRTMYFEITMRCLRDRLTPAEFMVFTFVMDRTVGWLKEWEVIRMKQFLHGSIPDERGFQQFCGTGLAERTIQRAIASLEESGLIRVRDKADHSGLREYRVITVGELTELETPEGKGLRYYIYVPGEDQKYALFSENVKKTVG